MGGTLIYGTFIGLAEVDFVGPHHGQDGFCESVSAHVGCVRVCVRPCLSGVLPKWCLNFLLLSFSS